MDDDGPPAPPPSSAVTDTIVTVTRSTKSPAMSFLDLPPEIRNKIYEWLFPKGRSAAQLLAKHCGGFIQMSDRFTLLATCRQIFAEASSLLRSQQRFVVKQPITLSEMMEENLDRIEAGIIGYILPTRKIDIIYDLDHGIIINDGAFVLQIDRDLRNRVGYYIHVQVTALISIETDFRRLKEWAQSGRTRYPMANVPGLARSTQIVLNFLPSSTSGPEASFADAVELMYATKDVLFHCHIRTRVGDGKETTGENNKSVSDVAAALLLFIHTLIWRYSGGICCKVWLTRDLELAFADLQHEDGRVEHVFNEFAGYSRKQVNHYLNSEEIIFYYTDVADPQQHDSCSNTALYGTVNEKHCSRECRSLLSVAQSLAECLSAVSYQWF